MNSEKFNGKYITKRKDLIHKVIDGETVLVHVDNSSLGSYLFTVFNETGEKIWKMLDDTKTIEDITSSIIEEPYDISYKKAFKEISHFISNLLEQGLIKLSDVKHGSI